MADGHQRTAWNHTLVTGLMFARAMGGKVNVLDCIPERYRGGESRMKTPAEDDAEAEAAFAGLELGLRAWSRQNE